MVEYNLGEGIEPEDTQGSQGAQPQHSLVSLCSWLKVPSFPSPGQGRAGHCALMLPLVRIRSFHSHQLVLLSCQEQRGLQCSDAFNSLRFGSFFQNLLSKTALHIPALISRLFLLKKNPKCLRTGAQCPPLCGEGRVPSGREEGKAQIVCEPDPATFAWQNSDLTELPSALELLWVSMDVRGCSSSLFQAYLVQVTALTLLQLRL